MWGEIRREGNRRFGRLHPTRVYRVVRMTRLPRLVRDLPRSREALSPAQSFEGARLRVELTRARLRLAFVEDELDRRVAASDESRRALELTRDVLEASVSARVGSGPQALTKLQHWLETFVREMRDAFPRAGLQGVAVTTRREGCYELAVGANVPDRLEQLLPAPDHVEFPECVRRHVPNAESFPFAVGDTPHWFVVLTNSAVDPDATGPAFRVVA